MAKSRKTATKPSRRLAVGQVYAVPLADGRYGAIRVIREDEYGDYLFYPGRGACLVVATEWIGEGLPQGGEPELRRLLQLTYMKYGQPLPWFDETPSSALWIAGRMPKGFVLIDREIRPSAAERRIKYASPCSTWEYFTDVIQFQWWWDHDRPAAVRAFEAYRAAGGRRVPLVPPAKTFAEFRKQKLLAEWPGDVKPALTRESREILKRTADSLEKLGDRPTRKAVLAELRACVEAFNRLNREGGGWIETDHREDLCQHIQELAKIAGLPDDSELTDPWREW